MQKHSRDLWPADIGVATNESSPVVILREQASLLGRKTHNLILAQVDSSFSYQGTINIRFYLVAPTMGDYKFELFQVSHQVEDFYPLIIYADTLGLRREVVSEDQLLETLADILSNPKTKNIIESILAQAGDTLVEDEQEIPF